MGWSGFFKGFSAVVVAIVLLLGGSYAIFQFLVSQFTAAPPRPTFPNDKPASTAKPAAAVKPSPIASPVAASPKPSPSPSPTPANKRARITLGEGLNVRQSPSADAERIDGVDYSDEVTVLEESPDKEWIKVRVDSSGVEGWIKSGYIEPVTPQ
ncbi:MAG: SH3 domain-containing protein [Leptolyngbyaceae cyanobacterium bins.302]|nr:SH3 domain-containing protein [Leptolyngbyaceae cyanobacterium bins.302]